MDLARIGLGIGDKLRNRLRRHRRIDDQNLAAACNHRNWSETLDRIVADVLVERRADGHSRGGGEQRVAIGGGGRAALNPALPPAPPGRLSIMTGRTSDEDSRWPMRRATLSVVPPGASPTIILIGRVG